MEELLNFHETLFVLRFHWLWMLVALGLGIWVGWYTAADRKTPPQPAEEADAP